MKKYLLLVILALISGCALSPVKRTDFSRDGVVIHSITGRGIWEADEFTGHYQIWALNNWDYYDIYCKNCVVKETILKP